jgi:hypothetical protein
MEPRREENPTAAQGLGTIQSAGNSHPDVPSLESFMVDEPSLHGSNPSTTGDQDQKSRGPRPTIWGIRRKLFFIGLGIGILVAVAAMAIGVGAGLAFGKGTSGPDAAK